MRRAGTWVLAAALWSAAPVGAWVAVGESESTSYYLDPDSIHVEGAHRRVWRMFDYKEPQASGVRSGKALIEIDCEADTYRYLRTMYYSQPQGRGKVLGGARERHKEHIVPGTMIAQLAKATCMAPGGGSAARK
ncbi:surface-adhesin E family protein [Ramlibacter sp.]|uniref:surface-adhesin E family protein n=1 Tax=Ramlibacter sp. TaxID=1917967 RepID=UPI0026036488|nr:surface-adhesin E family protein [Ramlibacter sp.]MDB5953570.1 hypothetical protein [Ramlibacter sp.]